MCLWGFQKTVQLPELVGKVCVWCVYEKPVQSSLALVGLPHISNPHSPSLNPPSLLPNWAQRYQTTLADTLWESILLHVMIRTDPKQAFSTSLQQW